MNVRDPIQCDEHGEAFTTFLCGHIVRRESFEWYSRQPDEENRWPDAWCDRCHVHFKAAGSWDDVPEEGIAAVGTILLLCHRCYERRLAECSVHYI